MRGITKRFRNFAANFDEMHHRENIKQRVSESKAERVWALPNRWSSESHQVCLNGRVVTEVGVANVSCFNRARALLACYRRDARRLNNHNTAKKNGYFLGHSDNLITLSLSLSGARPTREVTTLFILRAGRPRQYTAFLAFTQEKSACFFPRRTTAAGTVTGAT